MHRNQRSMLGQAGLNGRRIACWSRALDECCIYWIEEVRREYSCLIVMHDRLVVDGDYMRVKAFMAEYLLDSELIAKSARRCLST